MRGIEKFSVDQEKMINSYGTCCSTYSFLSSTHLAHQFFNFILLFKSAKNVIVILISQ